MPGSLVARDISKSYAAVQVLDRVSLVVSPGDRIGIVGPNGIGKSTLLRVLAGLEAPDRGQVIRGGEVEREMDALAARLGAEPGLAHEYSEALDRYLALGGEDFEARVGAVLDEV